ncbi:hypothetical protein VUR80DRAFT_9416 [Thermomyces stellatus]
MTLLPTSLSQASLAAALAGSAVGTYLGGTPPNPNPERSPAVPDTIDRLKFTTKPVIGAIVGPLTALAAHHAALAYTYPNIPASILRHGAANGLNTDLLTWTPATAVPLALILCAGAPLRLGSYASLGKNFTFALAAPTRLNTTGIYRYVQHPSYTGAITLLVSNAALLCRTDGVLSCWVPPRWYDLVRRLAWIAAPVWIGVLALGLWTRVRQEERMLKAKFGTEWEEWHAKTPRFLPWLF